AAALIAIDDYIRLANVQTFAPGNAIPLEIGIPTVLDVVIGSITFTGSLIASGKLMGLISGKPIRVPGGQLTTLALAVIVAVASIYLWAGNVSVPILFVIIAAALIFGITMRMGTLTL